MNRFDRGAGQRVIRSEHHGFYLYNARGDVVQRANAAGVVTHSYRYTAFGNELAGNQSANETSTNPWRYAGEYWDAHRGEYYLRARSFNPRLGRFTQPDPFWNIGNMQRSRNAITQAGNLFMYTMHNPVMWVDPSGLSATLPRQSARTIAFNQIRAATIEHVAATRAAAQPPATSQGASTSTQAPGIAPLTRSWNFSNSPIKCTSPVEKKMNSLEGGGGGMGGVGGSGGGGGGIAPILVRGGTIVATISRTAGNAYNIGFRTFERLKKYLGSPGVNRQWHHIVEQSQINRHRANFDRYLVHSVQNVVSIYSTIHVQISAFYSKIPSFTETGFDTGGKVFRDWLNTKSFEQQYQIGLDILRMFGVDI
ncbi:MAG: RHS repeat-associated core domain-containing protein, partial [Defluviitaleaceae bacterium]|nr:RHS repeat-associated core domain-containing protein [Defluviitaleaceae bacterium]